MRGLGSIPTGGNIFHWIFLFSRGKASDANIDIIAILVHFEKILLNYSQLLYTFSSQVRWIIEL